MCSLERKRPFAKAAEALTASNISGQYTVTEVAGRAMAMSTNAALTARRSVMLVAAGTPVKTKKIDGALPTATPRADRAPDVPENYLSTGAIP